LLARNPEAQETVFSEVVKAKEETDTLMGFINVCNYTKSVIEESLRLYPPAYFIDRLNIEEDEFKGMRIPKNSRLLFSVLEIHRHRNYWEEPLKFDPKRFASGNSRKHSAHYFPFGAGPRMCIGNNFAMYEMILTIAEIVGTYKISEKKTPIQIKPLITLKPKNAVLEFNYR
jgi:cytochrome P450